MDNNKSKVVMTDKEKIRAEIERLQKKYYQRGEESDAKHDGYGMYWGGVVSCLNEIHTLIDSLPEEPVSEDMEEAAEEAINSIRPLFISFRESTGEPVTAYDQDDMITMFKEGVQWGRKTMIEKVCEWIEEISHTASTNFNVKNFKAYIKNFC